MTKREKRLTRWLNNPPSEVPRDQVIAMIDYYFPDQYEWDDGSHIVVNDERLRGISGFGPEGDFTVVIKSGKSVKGLYLKRLATAIQYLSE
jgi:hypothetical protein